MPTIGAYEGLDFFDQMLHGAHFMLCAFAVLIACIPLLTEKGTLEHKAAGLIYLPVSFVALILASYMAWHESSMVLFSFNCFCAYLLLSGWRAVHEGDAPQFIDWIIPGGLFLLASIVTINVLGDFEDMRNFYLLFFAFNAYCLSWRDWNHLQRRLFTARHRIFFAGITFGPSVTESWMSRHVAGMVGSMLANLSVVVLTLLPLGWHWIWPATLIICGLYIAYKDRMKKRKIREAMAPLLKPKFRSSPYRAEPEKNIRRAA